MINQLSMYKSSKLDYRQLNQNDNSCMNLRSVEKKSDELYQKTLQNITNYKSWITALKDTLMERYVLSKDEVFELLAFMMKDPVTFKSSLNK
jgi:cell division protease FtsH